MVRITLNYGTSQSIGMVKEKTYEKIWYCPDCGQKYEVMYALRDICIECMTTFPPVFDLRESEWKRILWHMSSDVNKREFFGHLDSLWRRDFYG